MIGMKDKYEIFTDGGIVESDCFQGQKMPWTGPNVWFVTLTVTFGITWHL